LGCSLVTSSSRSFNMVQLGPPASPPPCASPEFVPQYVTPTSGRTPTIRILSHTNNFNFHTELWSGPNTVAPHTRDLVDWAWLSNWQVAMALSWSPNKTNCLHLQEVLVRPEPPGNVITVSYSTNNHNNAIASNPPNAPKTKTCLLT
jgi:hypothetical protein